MRLVRSMKTFIDLIKHVCKVLWGREPMSVWFYGEILRRKRGVVLFCFVMVQCSVVKKFDE